MNRYEYGQEDEFFDQLIEAGGVYEIFDGGMIKSYYDAKGHKTGYERKGDGYILVEDKHNE